MSGRFDALKDAWERSLQVLRAPRVVLGVYGSDEARQIHRSFTAPHPRFRLVPSKRWGVALLELPESLDAYLAGHSRKVVRQKRRLAGKHGFRYAMVSPDDYLDDILAVNRSTPSRQGRPMPDSYTDRSLVSRTFEGRPRIPAILGSDGRLRAYAIVIPIGDAAVVSTILGHADDLEDGLMYLLVSEIVGACIAARVASGHPGWLMYDTFWGAAPGLAYFKARLGFRPCTVSWNWRGEPDARPVERSPWP